MLVLTRKTKEEICIGNDITVTIVRVKGQTVRVGIHAPPHVRIMRSELTRDFPTDEDQQAASGNRSAVPSASIKTIPPVKPPAADKGSSTSMYPTEEPTNPRDVVSQRRFESPLGSTGAFSRAVARQRSNL